MFWFNLLIVRAAAFVDGDVYETELGRLPYKKSVSNTRQSSNAKEVVPVYPGLGNFDFNVTPVAESDYKWIARVVHSRSYISPHVCTASCIDDKIFITAATCIARLKVNHTTVVYRYDWLPVRAFVIPANGTQQGFDDIGFIIVKPDVPRKWDPVKIFDTVNRTDHDFNWFADIFNSDVIQHKVVGFSVPRALKSISYKQFYLSELPVVVNYNLCPGILPFKHKPGSFKVPCYHTCTVKEHDEGDGACSNYHGVEGGALYNVLTNKLLGVATWGPVSAKSLPVGFSVPNSENFFKNYECAKRIRNDNKPNVVRGRYQNLCKN